jgi:hypothetical protein
MYASTAPRGPACEITSPEPINKPVPIAPPNESMMRWREVIARFKDGVCPSTGVFPDGVEGDVIFEGKCFAKGIF